MTTKKRFINILVTICVATMFILPISGCDKSKTVASGRGWQVTHNYNLKSLNIGKDARVYAPEGYSLTMTVDGVETKIMSGAYKGKIVLTITKND